MPDLERDFEINLGNDDDFPTDLPVDWWLALVERDERDRDEGYEPDPDDAAWWFQETRGE